MSIGGVSSFAAIPSRDARAEFEHLREIHSKGPEGYGRRRVNGQEDAGPHPLAGLKDVAPAAAGRKVDFSV